MRTPRDAPETPIRTGAALGRVIKHLRTEANMTQEDVAKSLGIPRRAVIHIENEHTSLEMDRAIETLRLLGAEIVVRPR